MDVLTFIVEIAKAMAWPFTLLLVALLFRAEIRALLARVRKGKIGLAELEFEQGVAAATTTAETLGLPKIELPEPTAMVAVDPRLTILNAWLKVEAEIRLLLQKRPPQVTEDPYARPPSDRLLLELWRDSPQYFQMYNDLRNLRSRAVHEGDFQPNAESVRGYVELAEQLVAVLRAAK